MKRPSVRPLLGVTASLAVCAGSVLAAADPASPEAAPAAKPGWVTRLATETKKLAFWDKEAPPPAAAPETKPAAKPKIAEAAAPAPKPAPARGAKPESAKPASKKSKAAAAPAAPAPATVPGAPEPEKKSRWPRLPTLPFVKKPAAPEPETPAAAPPPAPTGKKKPAAAPARPGPNGDADRSTSGAEPAPAEEKKPGFFELSRLWPGGKKSSGEVESSPAPTIGPETEPPAVAGRKKASPATTAATKKDAAAPADPTAPAPAAKVPFWSRLASAITPGNGARPEKPATVEVPKGLAPLGASAPDGNTYVITKDDSPFYSFGPQQATPPDAYLSTGTVVTLAGKNWGWAKIQLPDGRTGMVDRAALRPALITDLIPSRRPGDSLLASLAPGSLKRSRTPSFVLPPAEMPDLPTSGDSGPVAGNPLLLPFSPEDVTAPGELPPLPEIPPLPEPDASPPAPPQPETPKTEAPEPAAPQPAAPEPAAPEPAAPAPPATEEPATPSEPPASPDPAPKE